MPRPRPRRTRLIALRHPRKHGLKRLAQRLDRDARSGLVLSTQDDTKTDDTQRALAICLTAYSFSATRYKSACVHSERENCARVRT